MNYLNIALLQMVSCKTQAANLDKGIEFCGQAKSMGADIALFPEMWNNGYNVANDLTTLKSESVSQDSEYVMTFKHLAEELDMAIGITFLETHEPLPMNTMCLFDRKGRLALHYSKVHTCDFDLEKNLTPGDDFYVAELDVGRGAVKLGAMICYDREFPESARILMLKGAEIILVPNACPMEINRISQLRARAFENMLGIATANYAYGQPDCNGHSTAFDGIAYREGETGSRDTLIVEAGEAEGVYLAAFPLDELRRYRQNEVHGNAYRRPDLYKQIISGEIMEPFIRSDHRGYCEKERRYKPT